MFNVAENCPVKIAVRERPKKNDFVNDLKVIQYHDENPNVTRFI